MILYDYIFVGGGCSSLSILSRMLQQPILASKKILILDPESKSKNDRTWCFWEKEKGHFEHLIYKQWDSLEICAPQGNLRLNIQPYQYKMIRALDLYDYVIPEIHKNPSWEWKQESVNHWQAQPEGILLNTDKNQYKGKVVFDSRPQNPKQIPGKYYFLQHFMGWVVETHTPVFDPGCARLMDFRIPQDGETRFMYVLPSSPTSALIEFTVFSETLLDKHIYQQELNRYLSNDLGITSFQVTHQEFGVIPMTNAPFEPSQDPRVIMIGTAGGWTKASTGYTFQFIQKNAAAIVEQLSKGKNLSPLRKSHKHLFYDSVLLRTLKQKTHPGRDTFYHFFKNNPPKRVFRFLDDESDLWEDLKIMSTVPIGKFLPAALKELF